MQHSHSHAGSLSALARHELESRAIAWLVALLSGFSCAVMAYIINLSIEGIDKLRFMATLPLIQPGGGLLLPWLVFNAVSCAPCLLATLGVAYLAPLAAGSGIPHIKAYCRGVEIPGLLTLKTLVVKALGAMGSIGAGLVAGKEGPFIQCGACIGWLLSNASHQLPGLIRGKCTTTHSTQGTSPSSIATVEDSSSPSGQPEALSSCTTQPQHVTIDLAARDTMQASGAGPPAAAPAHSTGQIQSPQGKDVGPGRGAWQQWMRSWFEQRRRHDAAAMGSAAGVAAAFVAPLAGTAYAVEEASLHFSVTLVAMSFFAGGLVVFFLWLLTSATTYSCSALAGLAFSSPLSLAFRGTAGTDLRFWWYVWEVPLIMVLGALGGALAALWTWLNTHLLMLRKACLKHPLAKVADVLLVCILTNTIRIVVAHQSPCLTMPTSADLQALEQEITSWRFFSAPTGLYPQLWCPEGQYSNFGQLFMMPLDVAVRSLLSLQPRGELTVSLLQGSNSTQLSVSAASPAAADLAATADDEAASFVFRTRPLIAYMVYLWGMLLLSYGAATPMGIFIPALGIGAAGGRVAGHLLRRVLRSTGVALPICLPGWSVMGATAMLVGMTRLTLANCLIVLESSGAVPMIIPMVLLTVPAKLLADWLFICIYDWQIRECNYEFLEARDTLPPLERAVVEHYQVGDLLSPTVLPDNRRADPDCTPHSACSAQQHLSTAMLSASHCGHVADAEGDAAAPHDAAAAADRMYSLPGAQGGAWVPTRQTSAAAAAAADCVGRHGADLHHHHQQQQQQQWYDLQQMLQQHPAGVMATPQTSLSLSLELMRSLGLKELPVLLVSESSSSRVSSSSKTQQQTPHQTMQQCSGGLAAGAVGNAGDLAAADGASGSVSRQSSYVSCGSLGASGSTSSVGNAVGLFSGSDQVQQHYTVGAPGSSALVDVSGSIQAHLRQLAAIPQAEAGSSRTGSDSPPDAAGDGAAVPSEAPAVRRDAGQHATSTAPDDRGHAMHLGQHSSSASCGTSRDGHISWTRLRRKDLMPEAVLEGVRSRFIAQTSHAKSQ